jgi:hypothetical protein
MQEKQWKGKKNDRNTRINAWDYSKIIPIIHIVNNYKMQEL